VLREHPGHDERKNHRQDQQRQDWQAVGLAILVVQPAVEFITVRRQQVGQHTGAGMRLRGWRRGLVVMRPRLRRMWTEGVARMVQLPQPLCPQQGQREQQPPSDPQGAVAQARLNRCGCHGNRSQERDAAYFAGVASVMR
jgi:hypothetical protein